MITFTTIITALDTVSVSRQITNGDATPLPWRSDVVLENKVLVSRRIEDKNASLGLGLGLEIKVLVLILVLTKKS